jgi:plasmid stabilization system protein ParE
MDVYLSELAEFKLLRLSDYLLEEWSPKTRDKFLKKLTGKINQISSQPESCPESTQHKGLYKCTVTKHSTFYYRILWKSNEIEIITLFDTRQSPEKLEKEL